MSATHAENPCIECAASKHLRDLLQNVKTTSAQAAILLVGPSGTGKSSLARRALDAASFDIRILDFRTLCHDDPVTTITAVLAAFQARQDSGPQAVVLDDIDFWAPAPGFSNAITPIETRIVAVLNDALKNSLEVAQPFVFIATACHEKAVHPALLCVGRLQHVVHLYPLAVAERKNLAETWIRSRLRGKIKWCASLDMIARQIATVTPGFVHADFSRFFSLVEEPVNVALSNEDEDVLKRVSEVFSDASLSDVLRAVVPSLLASAGGVSSLISNGKCTSPDSLFGLDNEIQQFLECITSVFASSTPQGLSTADPQTRTSMEIMKTLGTFRGLILHGPTGCGKTAMTKLAPALLPKHTVNFLYIDATAIVSSVIGDAEQKLTRLFAIANAIAPALLVVENIDILAPNRDLSEEDGGSAAQAFNRLLSTFLTQIDGVQRDHEGAPVFMLATSRSLDLIDTALLRPGRFEIHIELRHPDASSRLQILKTFLKSRDVELRGGLGKTINFNTKDFTVKSRGWTAPDIFSFGRELLLDERFGNNLPSL